MFGFFRRWKIRRELRQRIGTPVEKSFDGIGEVHIYPIPVPMRPVLFMQMESDATSTFEIYCWLIQECVYEYAGRLDLGVKMAPNLVQQMGEAILHVSQLTQQSVEEAVKKSAASQSTDSSTTL